MPIFERLLEVCRSFVIALEPEAEERRRFRPQTDEKEFAETR